MPTTIKLATWGKLPTYWPLYVALNKAAEKCNLLIEIKSITNDKDLVEGADLALWGGSNPSHGRLIPCMWRQPSWLLARDESDIKWPPNKDSAVNHKVFLLHPGTTNGDYGRLLGHKKRWWSSKITPNSYNLSEIHDCINNELSTSNVLLSFLPLHNLLHKDWSKLKLIDEFLGPNDCVTSFQILPDSKVPSEFEKNLISELRAEFDRLFFSEDILEAEINKNSPYESLKRFTNISEISNGEPFFQLVSKSESIDECVRSYLKYGCYFPYRPFGRIAQTINDVVKEKYMEAIKEGHGKAVTQLNEMYGANRKWSDLSYTERKSAFNKSWYYIDRQGKLFSPENELPNYFFHPQINDDLHPLRIFVYPTEKSPPTPLSDYSFREASSLSPVCNSESNGNIGRCHKNCFMCLITGSVSSIICNAKELLSQKLLSTIEDKTDSIFEFTQQDNVSTDSKFYNSLHIVWDDVIDFFDVFVNETNARPTEQPKNILISILQDNSRSETKRLLICILYNGDIRSGQSNGKGTATKTLEKLVLKLKGLGYHKSNMAIWKEGESEPECPLWESIRKRTTELRLYDSNLAYLLWVQV